MSERNKKHLNIREDRFVQRLLKRLPEEMRDTFTDEQLLRLKHAFDMTAWGVHSVDMRGIIGIGRWKYYYVLLMGKDKRRNKRLDMAMRIAEILILTVGIFVIVMAIFGILLLLGAGGGGDMSEWINDMF